MSPERLKVTYPVREFKGFGVRSKPLVPLSLRKGPNDQSNVGALRIRIGFWAPVQYGYNKEPQRIMWIFIEAPMLGFLESLPLKGSGRVTSKGSIRVIQCIQCRHPHNQQFHLYHMGGCQNYGPFLGTLNNRCRIIIGTQKGTIVLTTTHIKDLSGMIGSFSSPYTGAQSLNLLALNDTKQPSGHRFLKGPK